MTNFYELADNNRGELIFDKEQLLAPLQEGMLPPPHPMVDGHGGARLLPGQGRPRPTAEQRTWVERTTSAADATARRRPATGRAASTPSMPGVDTVERRPGHPAVHGRWSADDQRRRGGPLLGPRADHASSAALGLLFAKKAVHAALGVALVMIILGVFYIAQHADFLGIVQIFVYTGAVMMLFLFVLMLVGVDSSDSLVETIKGQSGSSLLLALGLGGLLISAHRQRHASAAPVGLDPGQRRTGNVTGVANLIFGKYVWAFEVTSALLITAALGAMVLAHRERLDAARRASASGPSGAFREGTHLAGLPAPGVYARHNAVDTPALLPDGTPSELSVSRVLTARDQVVAPERLRGRRAGHRARDRGGERPMSLVNYIYLATHPVRDRRGHRAACAATRSSSSWASS